jgi:hypothetical protein
MATGSQAAAAKAGRGERDENGVSRRTPKGWGHALAIVGVDDRPEIVAKYDGPLVLIQNSWAKWNSGPRRVYGTDFQIPEGAFWSRWKDARNRYFVAFSSVNGWPRKQLPDYGKLRWGQQARSSREAVDRTAADVPAIAL